MMGGSKVKAVEEGTRVIGEEGGKSIESRRGYG
jgi:hypothetical protein